MTNKTPIADAIAAVREVIEDGRPWYRLRHLRAAITYLEDYERVVAERDQQRERYHAVAETIEVDGVWYDRRDTVDALVGLLTDARKERDAARAELVDARSERDAYIASYNGKCAELAEARAEIERLSRC